MFLDVPTGFPGRMHDARIFAAYPLFCIARQGKILSKLFNQISNVTTKLVLLGDGVYRLSAWMMKPYVYSPNLTHAEKKFNKNFHLQECLRQEFSAFLKLVGDALLED